MKSQTHQGKAGGAGLRAPAILVFAALLVVVTLISQKVRTPTRPNIILISIDTLRYDHLGLYGYEFPTSPNLDEFSKEALVFSQAISQAPSTLQSHAAILTSQIPTHHGASWGRRSVIRESSTTLAEVLRAANYRTAGFHGGGQMSHTFGLDRGFESYELLGAQDFSTTVHGARTWIDQNHLGQTWTQRLKRQPFFLFLHNYHVHHPYTPKPEHVEALGVSSSSALPVDISVEYLRQLNGVRLPKVDLEPGDLEHIIRSYDAEVRGMDEAFGALIAYLRENELYENTLIVFTSDHGEEFNERGFVGWHSHTLFDELLRVPLLIKPATRSTHETWIEEQVRSMDIMPTLLQMADIAIPESVEGTSLWPLGQVRELEEDRVAISQREPLEADIVDTSVRTEPWKYIRWTGPGDASWETRLPDHLRELLFDLHQDPEEQQDLSREERDTFLSLLELANRVNRYIARPDQVELSEEVEDQLRALGYIHDE